MDGTRAISKRAGKYLRDAFRDASPKILRLSDIRKVLHGLKEKSHVPQDLPEYEALEYLRQHASLRRIEVDLPHRPETVFSLGDVSPLALAVAAKRGSYLCHYSAVSVHGLTTQILRVIYINVEQRPHVRNLQSLTQESINNAFRRPHRMTTNIASLGDMKLVCLNGMNTKRLGVVDHPMADGMSVPVTDLERTLIDIAVRPAYAGGVSAVLDAFRQAAAVLDVSRIAEYLALLDYVYPYHQAIGYYLERAGVSAKALKPMRTPRMKFDFYLAHGMRQTEFDSRWRLYVPKGL